MPVAAAGGPSSGAATFSEQPLTTRSLSEGQTFVVTSEMRQLLVSVAPVVASIRGKSVTGVGASSASTSFVEGSTFSTLVEGSTSVPPPPSKVDSILGGLILQLIGQFTSNLATCDNLILSSE